MVPHCQSATVPHCQSATVPHPHLFGEKNQLRFKTSLFVFSHFSPKPKPVALTMDDLKLKHANMEINLLGKQLAQMKKDYGELLLTNGNVQQQLTELAHQRDDLQNRLASANVMSQSLKEDLEAKILRFENQIMILKKQNQKLSKENADLEAIKLQYEKELVEFRMKFAKFEEEKEDIRKREGEENSRVTAKNAKLQRDLDAVIGVATDKFRTYEKRLSDLEQAISILNQGSQLNDTPQAMQEQESLGPEAKSDGFVGAQPGHDRTPIEEKTASSRYPGIVEVSSSDDDLPLAKCFKRKPISSEVFYRMEVDGGSSRKCRPKEKDSCHEMRNSPKKTVSVLKQCEKRLTKWDYEADLLDDLQKDTELCMKGICSLCRQNLLYTIRETSLAKSLTGGTNMELGKTIGDLETDPEVAEDCRTTALAHSKQLFDIYKNGNDPLFAHTFC